MEKTHSGCRELQIIEPTCSCLASEPNSLLPPDWTVVERPRSRSARSYGRIDKYYIEPGTKKQFRSLTSICKYLTDGAGSDTNPSTYASPDFRLPDDWLVEEQPRQNVKYIGIVDKCYIEPVTGRRFRSLVSVERYLSSNSMFEPKILDIDDRFTKKNVTHRSGFMEIQNHPMQLRNRSKRSIHDEVTAQMVECTKKPSKVKWVFNGGGGNNFSPYIRDSAVSEQARQKWSEAFVSAIRDRS